MLSEYSESIQAIESFLGYRGHNQMNVTILYGILYASSLYKLIKTTTNLKHKIHNLSNTVEKCSQTHMTKKANGIVICHHIITGSYPTRALVMIKPPA